MNRVLLTGRLTRDPEMRVVTNGKKVIPLSVPVLPSGFARKKFSGRPSFLA
jgi:single-stranded DNA-binding protein